MRTNTGYIYDHSKWVEDFLRRSFYEDTFDGKSWIQYLISMILNLPKMVGGSILALPFRLISMWSMPEGGFVETESDCDARQVADEISVLSYNVLGMPAFHADKEQRSGIQERIDDVFKVIHDADADVVMLQEVHAGSKLENQFIEEFKGDYKTFYHNIGPKVLFLGSGLMVMTKFANTEFEFVPFEKTSELATQKGFGVLTIKDDDGNVVMRIADTHLQSGHSADKEDVRKEQVMQIQAYANAHEDAPLVFGGDLNIDRRGSEYQDPSHPIHAFADGFSSDRARLNPTLADYEGRDRQPEKLAVDNILATNLGGWKMGKTRQVSEFMDNKTAPSDHGAQKVVFSKKKIKESCADGGMFGNGDPDIANIPSSRILSF